MFSQSYNPLSVKHTLTWPLTPLSSEQRKQQEHVRRRRTKEIERRRQAEFEQLRHMEKGITKTRQEGEQDSHQQGTEMLPTGMFEPVVDRRLLPPPLYIINSQDKQEDEGYQSEGSAANPPRTIVLKPVHVTPLSYDKRRDYRRRADSHVTDSSTICTEDGCCGATAVPVVIDASPLKSDTRHGSKPSEKDDDEDECSVPPHIIGAVGNDDEDEHEEDDEDFESFWRSCIPNISFETA